MSVAISSSLRAARCSAVLTMLDDGGAGSPASATIYAGERPAPGEPASGTLVATVAFSFPAGVVQPDGSLLLSVAPEALASADGAPAWLRVFSGTGVWLFDADVSLPGGAGDFWLAPTGVEAPTSTQVYAGGVIQLASGTLG
jgi:hypothetical protein